MAINVTLNQIDSDPIQVHRDMWRDCTLCRIGRLACNHVLYRGTLPCSVLFVGEGPGKSEDVIGEPFVGPSGKLLTHWINQSRLAGSYAITNIVACRPTDSPGGSNRKPSHLEVSNCRPRFMGVMQMASPMAVVLLGKTASEFFPRRSFAGRTLEVWHPAYVLRSGGKESSESKKVIGQLAAFWQEVGIG